MTTPIVDFVKRYGESQPLRLHMPGHKGRGALGIEQFDLTEVQGADSLYQADGIIRESEENASRLFGCPTFYSTEGSSLCIRAMLFLLLQYAREQDRKPLVLAGRNAHKTFLSGIALLDMAVEWLYGAEGSYLSCHITAESLEQKLSAMDELPVAVYLTTPDYLGNQTDVAALSAVCHQYGVLLVVDCAHGAYLRFLTPSRYPMDLGADLCCASAHKTLPVLTGGAYLHVSKSAPSCFAEQAKTAMSLFGSTSPSYLILQSLDQANPLLDGDYPLQLTEFANRMWKFRQDMQSNGYVFEGSEPIKLTVRTKTYGYFGYEYADLLRANGIECEFADRDFTVLMVTPEIGEGDLDRLGRAMLSIPRRTEIQECPPRLLRPTAAMTAREAMLSPSELLPVEQCEGRALASASVGCPPAVPIAVCGEMIDSALINAFDYYEIHRVWVVKKRNDSKC